MMRLGEIYLIDEVANKLFDKLEVYNQNHPDEKITAQKLAELFLDYGIRYLDISAID